MEKQESLINKKAKIGTRKYNWHAIKKQFFLSEYLEVEPFLKENKILSRQQRPSNNTATQTRGWGEEKRVWLEEQFEAIRDTKSKELEPILGRLLEGKKVVIFRILELLKGGGKQAKDYKIMWEMIKTELGEPTSISKNQNENKNVNIEVSEVLRVLKDLAYAGLPEKSQTNSEKLL